MTVAEPFTANALRRELSYVRRKHSNRTFWDAAQDAYIVVFSVVVVGSMMVSAFIDLAGQLSSCTAGGCNVARGPMPTVMLVAVAGATLRGLVALGPVVASRAIATWLLATPTSRRGLMRRPYALVAAGAVGAGAVFVLAAAVIGGAGVRGSIAALALGSGCGGLAAASASIAQPRPRLRRVVRATADLLLLLSLAGLVRIASGGTLGTSTWLGSPRVLLIAIVVFAAAVVLLVTGYRRLRDLELPEVVSGGELLAGLAGAAYGLDLALIGEIVASRRFRLLGARPSRRGHLHHAAALVEREFLRILRSPGRLVGYVALALVPELFDRAGLAPIAPLVAGLAGYTAVRWSASGFRRVWRSPGLRRSLPFDVPELLLCFTLPGAVLSLVWAAAVSFSLSAPAVESTVAVAVSVFAGVVRAASAKAPSYGGPLVTSPMGALPPGLVTMLFRGPDFAFIGTVALAVGIPATWTIGIPLVLLAIAVGMAISAARDRPGWMSPQPGAAGDTTQ